MFKVVRCGNNEPTPYLRTWFSKLDLEKDARIIDLGCGNGRNSKFILKNGFNNVQSFDLKGDYGTKANLLNGIPVDNNGADLILCNYVLCFLQPSERKFLASEIKRIAAKDCYLIVELYEGKQTIQYTTQEVMEYFLFWYIIHSVKDRFILQSDG